MLLALGKSYSQNSTSIKAILNDSLKEMSIKQELIYHNTSSDTLKVIFLQDWINAFSTKSTPLARRFSEEFYRKFHFAKEEERGATKIGAITNSSAQPLKWQRPGDSPDLIEIQLSSPLAPGEKVQLELDYNIKIPSSEFTRYGYSRDGNYKLRYWFLIPGVYDGKWEVYSHKNINDQYTLPLDIEMEVVIPPVFAAISSLETESIETEEDSRTVHFKGDNRVDFKLYLTRDFEFDDIETPNLHVITNLDDDDLNPVMKSMLVRRIAEYLENNLGSYPQDNMLVTKEDYASNPFYGLNQLPKFVRPFPDGFGYDLQLLKAITGNYLENSLLLNPREEKWVFDAIQIYLLMGYVDEYYPDMKILGSLSDLFGIRWFHAADLEFNDQYSFLYLHMARSHLDQALITPRDSLVKFNMNIANAYKAGVGLKYVEHYTQDETVSASIQEFYNKYKLQPVAQGDFEQILRKNSNKKIDWFFQDYVRTDKRIDFNIEKVKKQGDSLKVTIRDKANTGMPISLYGINDQNIVFKTWVEDIENTKTVTIPSENIKRLALNYELEIPEVNPRDNYEGVQTFLDKPIQVRLLKDVEDPRYYQVFFMPEFEYNLYDGITLGPKLYNKTILNRNFEFSIAPKYGFNSQTLVGGANFSHQIFFDEKDLFSIKYGASGSRFSFGYNLFYEKFTPFLLIQFRNENLRDNKRQQLMVRNVNVFRDQNLLQPLEVPDYSVFNINYRYNDRGMIDYLTGNIDFQLAKKFSKASFTVDYRKLFKNNRQINLRLFGGSFIYNDFSHSDYFSFALDRPTDYLFDYNYYGRSETSGLFSQQIIMAEGGFKSQLEPEFANQWLTTLNASTNLWKWIFVYGDVGVVKNKYKDAKVVYDSGIRLSLIADYFEIFFPVYSNLGWEINQENYDQRIRFIATLDIQTLTGLFSRKWY